ncbi:MAG: hypothetical protein CR981_03455 [Proteobacteria bacterium]|nr:MAG: hypothetical protein CR981_03455 [Pseudomonadota bacterium]
MLLNICFAVLSLALLLFLLQAPEETTSPLPDDQIHARFHLIRSKREADKHCASCHSENGESPLPDGHPPPFRCLFCHKRN